MSTNADEIQSGNVSVVTPTLHRPAEVFELLENLSKQTLLPMEVILVDGADEHETATRDVVQAKASSLPFPICYFKHKKGTAIQRNAGIEKATGDFIAFIDDDVRLEPDFLQTIAKVFADDKPKQIGGIVGYRTNCHFDLKSA